MRKLVLTLVLAIMALIGVHAAAGAAEAGHRPGAGAIGGMRRRESLQALLALYPDDDHDDHDGEDHGEGEHGDEEITGILENSFLDNEGGAVGGAWIGESWRVGLSWTAYDSNYGIPGAHAHEHGDEDPHVWFDVVLWSKTVECVTEALVELDPDHALAREEFQKLRSSQIPQWHFTMLADRARNEAFERAIEAGADVIITASYQASVDGFMHAGQSRSQAVDLLRRPVDLAIRARETFRSEQPGDGLVIQPLLLVADALRQLGQRGADGQPQEDDQPHSGASQ